ncbi:hypothetical protein ACFYKT_05680 [Cytobacillus sp. FJAT-53684]|uniref:Uncharacterized protein n=1 Tax=Cytobacillus mangrovibacter TaxID=3299024 RepID=A0ABW6JVF2_9BACI
MNIKQYYKKTASISLSASLASLIPPFFLIIYGIMIARDGRMVLIVLPFLVYSFFCYQYYLVCDRRSKSIIENPTEHIKMNQTLLNADHLLIHFLPAPSLRLLFFSHEGQLLGELKEMKQLSFKWFLPRFLDKFFEKRYGLYDETNNLIATYIVNKSQINVMDKNKKIVNLINHMESERRSESIFESSREEIVVKRSLLFMDYQFFHNQKRVGRLQKGMMPVEWERKIKDPNTPVLSFETKEDEGLKITILAILSKILH